MTKTFFDVFSGFDDTSNNFPYLKDVNISRISTNRSRDTVRLYMDFPTIVPKRQIYSLESQIARQYFDRSSTKIVIIERFFNTSSLAPKSLYDTYKDSILEELSSFSSILLSLFTQAKLDFNEDGHLRVTMEDSIVARKGEKSLHDILDKIFCERCGLNLIIDFEYKEPSEKKKHEQINVIRKVEKASKPSTDKKPSEDKEAGKKTADSKKIIKQSDIHADTAPLPEPVTQRDNRKNKFSKNPDLIYGRQFQGEFMPISDIIDDVGAVMIRGEVIATESRTLRNDKVLLIFAITDDTDTIRVKLFLEQDKSAEVMAAIQKGVFISVRGVASIDPFDHDVGISSVRGIMKIPSFRTERMDQSVEKRVELHCHTKMSDMDGVSDVKDIIKCAKKWGHKAIAITDHGVVAAFPDADHSISGDDDFKIIYGTEAYLVDDIKPVAEGVNDDDFDGSYVVFDLETTGLNARKCKIIEIGAVRFDNGSITDRFSVFVNPEESIPRRITELTSITNDMVSGADPISKVLPQFKEFCRDAALVAHNADFDCNVITASCKALGIEWDFARVDTIPMARLLLPQLARYKLDKVARELNVPLNNHHRAVDDAECTAHIFEKLIKLAENEGITSFGQLNEACVGNVNSIQKDRPFHCIILAKNDLGRINLYRLVSESHITYFKRKPKIPKSLLEKYREGLIIGSACSEGELYQSILKGFSDDEQIRLASFYDYLEVQPVGNNNYLMEDDKYGISSVEDLKGINRRIIELGEELNKPVVATCDVHFLHPKDAIYRQIIQAKRGFKDADVQPPLYLHTTDEMLDEFSYLGREKAYEVVIGATNRIADMCEKIHPTRPDKCPPVIADSDKLLRQICYTKAKSIYGDPLPDIVTERLERELNSIIGNGYAVMYIIAQKLVWKSNEDGYLVGSRGSVGSSFAATMAGITEVNPLSPHYICPNCHYVDFTSDLVKSYAGRAGCDMPDAVCPKCSTKLIKEGFDIPFETFLGFKGNKEPDIDLNFSGDYQNKAHRYTEVIFGEGQTFRAGTIGTLADKTAYGYIKSYYEERGVSKRSCEIDRIVEGCVGIRRTTGQHPGGIIVLPTGEDIYSFTPVQHPANDMTTDIITTHFDYHSIDSNLLKLDILGHDDPTMIRMLEDITGESASDIPLDDKQVMSLFMNTDALGVRPEDLWADCKLGTLGIPEFGTDFAMGMLMEAKPTEFSDLVRIAGLAHGTDVWLGNAQTLIAEGTATISTAICTRDDIMTYLIGKGMDSEESFKIMEAVRKGTVAKGKCSNWDEWKADMRSHEVPEWYISSCEKIKYMFPKAHAAAYVMMAWRIAYWKINNPLAYYAAYFSIRAKAFNYEKMCLGMDVCIDSLKELQELSKSRKLKQKESGLLSDLRSVQEFYSRGLEFLPVDLYKSDSRYFKVEDGKLRPPLSSIDGVGETQADSLALAASQKEFSSREDVKNRGKVTQTGIDTMVRLGIASRLPENDQLSFFDLV